MRLVPSRQQVSTRLSAVSDGAYPSADSVAVRLFEVQVAKPNQVIVELVAATTTETGLRIVAEWDQGNYPTGVEITDAELAAIRMIKHEWHPEWNC